MKKHYFSVALLPNLITMFNLFSGFLAIMMMFHEKYGIAAGLIALALLWDSLDGHIARIFKNSTAFGKELDSLADIVSFIVVPSVFVTKVIFSRMSPWTLFIVFLFLAAGAYRLARFNIKRIGSRHFEGLPTPAAGLMVVMFTFSCHQDGWIDPVFCPAVTMGLLAILSYLMVSRVAYPKLSNVRFADWQLFFYMGLAILVVCSLWFNPATAFTFIMLFYILIAPLQQSYIKKLMPEPKAN